MSTGNSGSKLIPALLQPVMQYGFAGFALVLLGFMFWQMRTTEARFDKMLDMQRETNQVIERNTAAIDSLTKVVYNREG